jgi:hypothetical protein
VIYRPGETGEEGAVKERLIEIDRILGREGPR